MADHVLRSSRFIEWVNVSSCSLQMGNPITSDSSQIFAWRRRGISRFILFPSIRTILFTDLIIVSETLILYVPASISAIQRKVRVSCKWLFIGLLQYFFCYYIRIVWLRCELWLLHQVCYYSPASPRSVRVLLFLTGGFLLRRPCLLRRLGLLLFDILLYLDLFIVQQQHSFVNPRGEFNSLRFVTVL